jgi:hypothetical protein
MKQTLILLALMAIIIPEALASVSVFEAGPFAIILNQNMEKTEILSSVSTIPVLWFTPVTSKLYAKESRELIKENYYEFEISDAVLFPDATSINHPMTVFITENLNRSLSDFAFTGKPVKEISVGRLRLINTTLYSGDWMEQTPHYVEFSIDGFKCLIYHQDISETSFIERLQNIDIIKKADLKNYTSILWT